MQVTDPILVRGRWTPRTSARTFSEAAINLTDAEILPTGGSTGCIAFAFAYLKPFLGPFNSTIEDFLPVNSNIGYASR